MKATSLILLAVAALLGAISGAHSQVLDVSDWMPELVPGYGASLLASGLTRPDPCTQGSGSFDALYVGTGDGNIQTVGDAVPMVFSTTDGPAKGLATAQAGSFAGFLYASIEHPSPVILRFDSSGVKDGTFSFTPDWAVENGVVFGPGDADFGRDLYLAQFKEDPPGIFSGKITRVRLVDGTPVQEDIASLGNVAPLGLTFGPGPGGTVLYIAEQDQHRVSYVDSDYHLGTLYTGDALFGPRALALSPGGGFGDGFLYIGDFFVDRVYRIPLSGGPAEIVARFPGDFSLKDIRFTDRGTLVVTGSDAGVVVEIYPLAVPEPVSGVLTGLSLVWIVLRRRAVG